MFRGILIYGTIAGLIVGGELFGLTVWPHTQTTTYGVLIGYLTMLIALSAVFAGVKRYRDVEGGGVIKFLPALGMGLAISFVASLFYVVAWEAALAVTHMDFGAAWSKLMIANAKSHHLSGAALAKAVADADAFRRNYANPLYRLTEGFMEIFPVGILVSVFSAALLRNSRFLPARRG